MALIVNLKMMKLGPLNIKDSDSINTSFPTFKDEFKNLGGNIF